MNRYSRLAMERQERINPQGFCALDLNYEWTGSIRLASLVLLICSKVLQLCIQ